MSRALSVGGNASSVHAFGRRARALIEDAREKLAAAVGCARGECVFTSGATEALQLAMESAGAESLIVSAVEHDAVFEHATRALGADRIAPVGADGIIDLRRADGRCWRRRRNQRCWRCNSPITRRA